MFRSNKTAGQFSKALLLSASALILTPLQAADFWLLQLGFDANGAEIQQVKRIQIPDGQRRTSLPSNPAAVSVSLRSEDGKVLQQLSIDDPRIIRVPMLPGSAQGHQFVVREEGTFTLIVPAQPEASLLQLQWADRPDQAIKKTSSPQQLSLQPFKAELQLN